MIFRKNEVSSDVMGHHEYCKTWVPIVEETLQCQMKPGNIEDKYAVPVIKKVKDAGHLMNSKRGKFVETVFFP